MTELTSILQNEPGIQYQGIDAEDDETESYPVQGVIFGYFMRGRYDKPMTITQDNIRGILGFDFNNPYYRVVQDVLNEGVPSVQVMRLMNEGERGVDGLSAYQIAVNFGFIGTEVQWLASLKGANGSPGLSAYQVARNNGFVGTEAQWLESIKGLDGVGAPGSSAYQIARNNGFIGTEAQWLASLKGNDAAGLSAYQIAVKNGFTGTEAQWLLSLQGQPGLNGKDGIGLKGSDGLSAYQVAVRNGFVGTEAQWLASLKVVGGGDLSKTTLSGLNISGASGPITQNDTLLLALAKLQSQLNTLGAPHSDSNVSDKGGEGYYPFSVTDGTLYTKSQTITLQPGYYRMACSGLKYTDPGNSMREFKAIVTRVLTEERIIGSAPKSGWHHEFSADGLNSSNLIGKGGWSEKFGHEPDTALKYIFKEAIEVNKGPDSTGYYSYLNGGNSAELVISKIMHFLEPIQIRIDIEVPHLESSYSNAYDLTKMGTGFVWIRSVPAPTA
ncbi:hypothetical protein J2X86_002417 [Acinetobacter lwoffii]|uniref:Uncharacterized protein n=1 Tax=Acinetobacter lwoffii TaxID=28090 RepID=A0AAW8LH23_ACILW|nr:hypothetical protein [Acinetobacter lwoffii]MDR6630362.1 hypothetical protein [Acinetobacter lwoffii]